jgi:hypothetical protein
VDATHAQALFAAIAKLADELGPAGTEIFALAELGKQVTEQLLEKTK